MRLPSVHAYLDYRAFLADWFEARKRQDPDYSHSAFAEAAGCSRSALSNVLAGSRTPRSSTLDAFARAMGLTGDERNRLGILVELEAAPDLGRRQRVLERLLSTEAYGSVRNLAPDAASGALARYLAHWWIPAIRELVALEGFREDPAWIARTLHPPITEEQARAAIATLLEIGVVRREEGRLVTDEIRLATDPETADAALATYYREEVTAVLAGLDTDLNAVQHINAATLLLDESSIPEVKHRLHQLAHQLATLGDTRPPGPARVYQLAVCVLPLSERVDGAPTS